MDKLIEILMDRYGLTLDQAKTYAEGTQKAKDIDPMRKAMDQFLHSRAVLSMAGGVGNKNQEAQENLVARRDLIMKQGPERQAQQDLVARRDKILGNRSQADLVADRDKILNKKPDYAARGAARQLTDRMAYGMAQGKYEGEIDMPPDNSPLARKQELQALADYKAQGFFDGEIQMPAMNARTGYPAISNIDMLRGYGMSNLPPMVDKKPPTDY